MMSIQTLHLTAAAGADFMVQAPCAAAAGELFRSATEAVQRDRQK
jgi:hypothetical protein